MQTLNSVSHPAFRKMVCLATVIGMVGVTGCTSKSGVAPSKAASNAGTGAAVGALGGAAVGGNSSMGTGTGLLGGAAAGALVGGVIGLVQDARDRKEQDRLSQERAFQQDMAKKRAEELRSKAAMEEELAIAQGFRISDIEINDAKQRLETASERLKRLEGERSAALAKKKDLDETRAKTLDTEAKIAELEEELARLKGEDVPVNPTADATGAAAAKPGI